MSASTPTPGGTAEVAGRTVARVGYGAMQLERLHDDPATGRAVLRRALELGVDHIDTAEFYGVANELIRDAVGDGALVASKVGATPDTDGPRPLRLAQRPEELRADLEANLSSLGLEQIALVNLRRAERGPGLVAEGEQRVDLDDQLATMIALRDEGKIGSLGISNVGLDELLRALPAGISCVQNAYSLLSRGDEELLRLCHSEGIAWVPYFPLGGPFAGMPKVTEEPAVLDAARALDATPAQIGLAWLLQHAPNVLLIPGTATLAHLEENVAAGSLLLDEQTVAALDAIPSRSGDIVY